MSYYIIDKDGVSIVTVSAAQSSSVSDIPERENGFNWQESGLN
jgi:hypothetical protein